MSRVTSFVAERGVLDLGAFVLPGELIFEDIWMFAASIYLILIFLTFPTKILSGGDKFWA